MIPPATLQLLGASTGGIRRHVVTLSDALRARGAAVTIAGPAGVLDGLGTLDVEIAIAGFGDPHRLPQARRAVRRAAGGCRIIHAHGLKAAVCALRGDRPVVLTVHNVVIPETAGMAATALRQVEAAVARRSAHVIAVSPAIADRFKGIIDEARLSVIVPAAPTPLPRRPPSEVRQAHRIPEGARLVVTAARLHPQKNLPMLISAFDGVARQLPEAHLLIVGDGPDRAALRSLVEERSLQHRVTLAGSSPYAVDELAAADVVALSSNWEGSPIVAAEALQLGRPVVATDVGDVAEVVENGVSGWLVPVGDEAAFEAALLAALGDAGAAQLMGAEGRVRAAGKYDPEKLVDDVCAVYSKVARR